MMLMSKNKIILIEFLCILFLICFYNFDAIENAVQVLVLERRFWLFYRGLRWPSRHSSIQPRLSWKFSIRRKMLINKTAVNSFVLSVSASSLSFALEKQCCKIPPSSCIIFLMQWPVMRYPHPQKSIWTEWSMHCRWSTAVSSSVISASPFHWSSRLESLGYSCRRNFVWFFRSRYS